MKDTNPVITTLLKCQRCQWEWYPRQSVLPERCPHCKSRLWQTPLRFRSSIPAGCNGAHLLRTG